MRGKREGTYDGASSKAFGGGWELVALAVPERGCGACCVSTNRIMSSPSHSYAHAHDLPERPIQRTRKLRRIAHQRALIPQPCIHKRSLNRLDPPVHHIARRDAVCSGFCVREGHLGYARGGGPGVDGELGGRGHGGDEQPAVPVGGVFAEADVGGDEEGGEELEEGFDGEDDGPGGVVCGGAAAVLLCPVSLVKVRETLEISRANAPSRTSAVRRTR